LVTAPQFNVTGFPAVTDATDAENDAITGVPLHPLGDGGLPPPPVTLMLTDNVGPNKPPGLRNRH
jgi:hypothetical protein